MKKIMRLVGVQLLAMLSDIFSFKRKTKSNIVYIGLVLLFLLFGGLALFYWFMIGSALNMYGSIQLLPAIVMAITCFIVMITTINKVKGTIFGFRDYDMVMALPIKSSGIVASRLSLLYALNMFFVLILMLPMIIAYGFLANPEYTFYIFSIILMFVIPLIPIIVASVLGTAIAYVASKFRYSNLINIIITMVFFVGIMALSMTVDESSGVEFANISQIIMERINGIYPLASLYSSAVSEYNVMAFLVFVLISVGAFMVYSYFVGKVFKQLNSAIMNNKARANYKMQELKTASPIKALYRKEFKRYFASTLYVLNTSIGIVFLILGTIALFFVDLESIVGEPQIIEILYQVAPIPISFFVILSCTTMASISIEGRNLWIAKSLPITPKKIFLAKMYLNITIAFPAIICSIIISFILKLNVIQTLFIIIIPSICILFTSVYGLLINLLLPNFNWTTEAMIVKQSAAVLIVTFTGFFVVGIPIILIGILSFIDVTYILGGYALLLSLITFVLYRVLLTWGSKRFTQLG